MRLMRCAFWLAVPVLLLGCATTPQAPVTVSSDLLSRHEGKVGVVMSTVPKVDTAFPGAYCLLCMAAASTMNSSLTTHAHTLSADEMRSCRTSVVEALKKKGFDVTDIADPLDIGKLPKANAPGAGRPDRDFSSLKARYGIDRLYVLEVTALGFERPYAAYVPTGDPQAVVRGKGYLINFSSGTYDWYQVVNAATASEGKWDEAPAYPGLTNAYFQSIEKARNQYVGPFRN